MDTATTTDTHLASTNGSTVAAATPDPNPGIKTAAPTTPRPWMPFAIAAAIIALGVIGFVMLGGSDEPRSATGNQSSSADFLAPSAEAALPVRIQYKGPDGPIGIANNGTIPVSDELTLAVSVSPYPPTSFDLDVDLYLTNAAGDPVTDAAISAEWDMIFMFHGPFETTFRNEGNGHYVAPFDLFMVGPWELLTEINAPDYDPPDDLALSIFVWPE